MSHHCICDVLLEFTFVSGIIIQSAFDLFPLANNALSQTGTIKFIAA
jgi:hypothetical protein